jgi:Ni/Co efflux regulator RcnB
MKTTFITGLLIATMLVPATTATAQNRELRRDRQDIREEQRELRRDQQDLRDARRTGDRDDVRDARSDVREERRDVRDARQDYREDRRDYRQDRRFSNRYGRPAPRFSAPFRYQRFGIGASISPRYWGNGYRVSNHAAYRLPTPGRYQQYVRHYDDLLLVNTRTGRVVRVYNRFYW